MNELWRELVDQLRTEHDITGEAFAEAGHQMIAAIAMQHIYDEPCPCGCQMVDLRKVDVPQ